MKHILVTRELILQHPQLVHNNTSAKSLKQIPLAIPLALLIWTAIRDAPHTGRARLFGFLKIIVVMLVYLHKWDLVHINQFVDSFNNSWKLPAIIVKDHVSIDR